MYNQPHWLRCREQDPAAQLQEVAILAFAPLNLSLDIHTDINYLSGLWNVEYSMM